jgi:hypothetical protein
MTDIVIRLNSKEIGILKRIITVENSIERPQHQDIIEFIEALVRRELEE